MRIDYEDALLLLKQIVADRGEDWIYPNWGACHSCDSEVECEWHYANGCRYFTASGQPACIVGEFISRTLTPHDYSRDHMEGRNAAEVLNDLDLELDERTESLLVNVQGAQDANYPWGEALETAIAAANKFTK